MPRITRVISNSLTKHKIGEVLALDVSLLEEKELHHLNTVLRIKPGDELEIFFKDSKQCFLAKLINERSVELTEIIEIKKPKQVHLVVALIKPNLSELIIEKCTELGLSSICFFQATHHREGAVVDDKKINRYKKIVDAALKQSRSFVKTELKMAENLKHALSNYPNAKGVYLSLGQAPNIINVLTSFNTNLEKSSNFDDLYLIVGPEAGLSEEEVEVAKNAGATAASLGENILRTETAAILSSGIAICFAW